MNRQTLAILATSPIEVRIGFQQVIVSDEFGAILHIFSAKSVIFKHDGEFELFGDLESDPLPSERH